MPKIYEKCVLTHGYAIVVEKTNPLKNWFPKIYFFDENGNFVVSLLNDSVKPLFQSLLIMEKRPDEKKDRIVCEWSNKNKKYQFAWVAGWLYLFPSVASEDLIFTNGIDNRIITMDQNASAQLLAVIQKLA